MNGKRVVAVAMAMAAFCAPGAASAEVISWGGYGSEAGQFRQPQDVAVAPNGDVYVADFDQTLPRVQRFDAAGAYLGSIGQKGVGDGKFERPLRLATTPAGDVYVLDYPVSSGSRSIQRFSAGGAFEARWSGSSVNALAVAANDDVYAPTEASSSVVVFHSNGEGAFSFGSAGSGPGQFLQPLDIDIDAAGNVYVLDLGVGDVPRPPRVQVFTATGSFVRQWLPSTGGMTGVNPNAIAIGPGGDVYVLAGGWARIGRYDPQGNLLAVYELPQLPNMPFKFFPGLDFGGGLLYVVDSSYNPSSSSATAARILRIDLLAPEAKIAGSREVLTGAPVSFDASASSVPLGWIEEYKWDLDGNGSFETGTGGSPTVSHVYPQRGAVDVSVRVVSDNGGVATATQRLDVLPAPPPGPVGVSIDGGAQYTNDPNVTVSVRWPPFASHLMISNDGGFFPFSQRLVDAQIPWRLRPSGPERLPKTIYVRFLGGGSGPETHQDDIILDQTAPTLKTVRLESGSGAVKASLRRGAGAKLRVGAVDRTSGVRSMQIAKKKSKPGKWRRFRRQVSVRGATGKLFVRVRDGAGNASPWKRAAPAP